VSLFRYEATDKTGRIVRGVMDARSEADLAGNLAAMGYALVSVSGSASTVRVEPGCAPTAGVAPVSVASRVPLSALAAFFRQFASLVAAGTPVLHALSELTRLARDRGLASALPGMTDAVQMGRSLSQAMAACPGIFPAHAVASVWSGELSGRLEIALNEVASGFEAEARDHRLGAFGWIMVKWSVISFVIALPALDIRRMLPAAVEAGSASGGSLPAVLGAMWSVYLAGVVQISIPIAAPLIVSWIVWKRLKRAPSVRTAIDEWLLRAPAWGRMHRCAGVARFLRTLEYQLDSGVPLGPAWDAASLTPRNNAVAARLRSARTRLGAENTVAECVAASGMLDGDDLTALEVGGRTGKLPQALGQLASAYRDRYDVARKVGMAVSVSLLIALMIALNGAAIAIAASGYFDTIFRITDFSNTGMP